METRILEKLACPSCAGGKPAPQGTAGAGPALICAACGATYPNRDGILDFAGDAAKPRIFSSQWAMEFRPITALYERVWRPLVTAPFSDLAWELEQTRAYLALSPRLDLLDLACGPGNFTRHFAKTITEGTVVGVDLSLPMLKKGLRELKRDGVLNIMLMRVDVTKWPFAAGSFDRVHCAGALHLFPDLPGVFASIRRSLRDGGIFVGSTYCVADGAAKRRFQDYVSTAHGFHWFRPEELAGLVSGAGFTGFEFRTRKQGIVFCAARD
jgi:SAM-dependent methyltransferase/uncharacterized protein YbaR (Trm112 family)